MLPKHNHMAPTVTQLGVWGLGYKCWGQIFHVNKNVKGNFSVGKNFVGDKCGRIWGKYQGETNVQASK